MKRRTGIFTAATAVVIGLAVAAPAEAHAADNSCLHIGRTSRSGNTITGYGSISCGTGANLTIQRSRWYGWEDLTTTPFHGTGHDAYISYDCGGTGKHDFRTIVWGYNVLGDYIVKSSNVITASC
ncbi:MAG TPA: hypothetical protein VI248_21140 [Kineosporiaceae bacterium]